MITNEGFHRSYDTEADRISRRRIDFPEVKWVAAIGAAVLLALMAGVL
jgi:hypothetical protein